METYALLCQYSAEFPQHILQVDILQEDGEDLLLFYKGHVSSLMRATPADESVLLWEPTTQIVRIELLQAPFNPVAPVVLVADITLEQLHAAVNP